MTDRWRRIEPGPRSDDFKIGCVVGLVSGLVGCGVATVALLAVRPEWIAREGDTTATIITGLAGGWAVGVAAATLGNLILVAAMSALERVRGRAPTRFNVALLFLMPVAVAAITLWLTASVNR